MKSLTTKFIPSVKRKNMFLDFLQTICSVHILPEALLVREAGRAVQVSSQDVQSHSVQDVARASAIESDLVGRVEATTQK